MRTKLILIGLFLGFAVTVFSQQNYASRHTRTTTVYNKPHGNPNHNHKYHPQGRVTVQINPPIVYRAPRTVYIYKNNNCRYCNHCHTGQSAMVIKNYEFNELLDRIDRMYFDDEKVSLMERKLDQFWFTSFQISQMMRTLNFEDNKLEIAKYAYTRTVDPEHYDVVFDELNFNSSKKELDYYINESAVCWR